MLNIAQFMSHDHTCKFCSDSFETSEAKNSHICSITINCNFCDIPFVGKYEDKIKHIKDAHINFQKVNEIKEN